MAPVLVEGWTDPHPENPMRQIRCASCRTDLYAREDQLAKFAREKFLRLTCMPALRGLGRGR